MASFHILERPWQLAEGETPKTFESWRQNMMYTLSLASYFSPLLQDEFTWQKQTASNSMRIPIDDTDNAEQKKEVTEKNVRLELMLGEIANFCPVIDRNMIMNSATSLKDIWQMIRQHFGIQEQSGAYILDLALILPREDAEPEELYQRLYCFFENNLLTSNGGIEHHGVNPPDEVITPTLENTIVTLWLQLLSPGLPGLVKEKFCSELRNKTVATLKPEISALLPSLLDELKTTEASGTVCDTSLERLTHPEPHAFKASFADELTVVKETSALSGALSDSAIHVDGAEALPPSPSGEVRATGTTMPTSSMLSTDLNQFEVPISVTDDLKLTEEFEAKNEASHEPPVEIGMVKDSGVALDTLSSSLREHCFGALHDDTEEGPHVCAYCEKGFGHQSELEIHMKTHSAELHVCDICSSVLQTSSQLKSHMETHTGASTTSSQRETRSMVSTMSTQAEKKHACPECGKVLTQPGSLNRHMKIHTGGKPHVCLDCGMKFRRITHLKIHMKIHTGEKSYVCSDCGKAFREAATLKAHVRIHTGEKPYECLECGKRFSERNGLKRHSVTHTGVKRHTCSLCGRKFGLKDNLNKHMRTHKEDRHKSHICKECGKGFYEVNTLNSHMITHNGGRDHLCSECGKRFSCASTLKRHIEITHDELKLKQHACPNCGKAFWRLHDLTLHIRTHTGERPYSCHICHKTFPQMSTLNNHLNTHKAETEKPYVCSECNKGCSSLSALKWHKLSHSEEWPHVCTLCGKAFKVQSRLKYHMMTHTGEKSHGCLQCGSMFRDQGALTRHMRTHTEDKPHSCSECDKTFKTVATLKFHMTTHGGGRPYTCECGKTFRQSASLGRHMKTHITETFETAADLHLS